MQERKVDYERSRSIGICLGTFDADRHVVQELLTGLADSTRFRLNLSSTLENPMLVSRLIICTLFAALGSTALAQDVHILNGQVVEYDTERGSVLVDSLLIDAGGTLRVKGADRFRLVARRGVIINGILDVSGFDALSVGTLNTTHIAEPGAEGGPLGGPGGRASFRSSTSSEGGMPGSGLGALFFRLGGGGGESGYQFITGQSDERRGAGGGGGVFAADQPVNLMDLGAPENKGLVARSGMDGSSMALGARTGLLVPRGGVLGDAVFTDMQADNDFYGRKVVGGSILVGELDFPFAGSGGGGGGDAVASASFPSLPFYAGGDEKGAGGGGGGGLGILIAPYIGIGPAGQIRADGGDGGAGENTYFFNRVGGGSGAGSGGSLILQAREMDLRFASAQALSALGGEGGAGRNDVHGAVGAGGNGGPGVIQIHVLNAATDLHLPPGVGLDTLSAPRAHILLPEPGL
ncbi:MAG: hypothetical protein ACI87O_002073 [Planctomycetota bacterium]